jgi:hypothetical protein
LVVVPDLRPSIFSMNLFCAVVFMTTRSLLVFVGVSDVSCLYAIALTRLLNEDALFVVLCVLDER